MAATTGDNVYAFKEGDPIYFIRGKHQGGTGKFISSAAGIARVSVDGPESIVTQVDHNQFRLHPRAGFVMVPLEEYEVLIGALEEWSLQMSEHKERFIDSVVNGP